MPDGTSWRIAEPETLDLAEPVTELHVRLINGTVNVVGGPGPAARVEISELTGPPLLVRHSEGRLVVAYEDTPWPGFLKWLDRRGWNRHAVVSVSVPSGVRLTVGVVGASAVISGISGPTTLRGVSGDATLVGLGGPVQAETVSGSLEAQSLAGALRFASVSGDLTLIDGRTAELRSETVSGATTLDLYSAAGPVELKAGTVSGDVAMRLPEGMGAKVDASTAGGAVSSAFGELSVDGGWGGRRLTGTLGNGAGRIRVNTVSGAVALLRRPPDTDPGPADAADAPEAPDTPSFRKDA
ncbi:DUF4097 family beta strand repeat-containing protein [Streptomyces aidingensis]|uniref:Putative adhesin n=1 Tax=Streptomyces aidingensis TaxID=910347 RepID=A0A1I1TMM3_9ACTN|nr:DUF4097 family beta strand repeat-containing protein [Streptomyces aidingensis]SFD59926.1 Putative adhesin [Streptomyces aidingensis]